MIVISCASGSASSLAGECTPVEWPFVELEGRLMCGVGERLPRSMDATEDAVPGGERGRLATDDDRVPASEPPLVFAAPSAPTLVLEFRMR